MPRWFWGVAGALIYLEMCVAVTLGIHFPTKPDPVFEKPTIEYHWVKGPWDDDWDGCDPDLHICYEEPI